MTHEDYQWLEANPLVLQNTRLTQEQSRRVFNIYNSITGENKPPTSCGRCVQTVKNRLKFEYEKQRNKN